MNNITLLRVICYAVMTCPRNNPHLPWPISLSVRELLASLAVNFCEQPYTLLRRRFSVSSQFFWVFCCFFFAGDPLLLLRQPRRMLDGNTHAEKADQGIRSKTHISLNTAEQRVRRPGLSLLSIRQIRRDRRAKMGEITA